MEQVIGLDVSKAWLDGHVASTGRRFRVTNDQDGIDAMVRQLDGGAGCIVVMEASGGYERLPHRELMARGVPAAVVNPKRVRDFARGMGHEAKTDRVDAAVIGHYGTVKRPAATPVPSPAREELAEILACRRQVVEEIKVRRQQLAHLRGETARERAAAVLQFLEQERRGLGRLLRAKVEQDEALEADFRLLTSLPGCGPILAATLLAELPELGTIDRRRIASLTAKRGPFRDRYRQLTAKGKAPKLALTAVMRKMLVTLNAMLRTGQAWRDADPA